MAVMRPPDQVRRLSVLTVNFQDLGVLLRFTNTMALDYESVARFGAHL
jgi:hypothetical protein